MNTQSIGNTSVVSVVEQCMSRHRIYATDNIQNINLNSINMYMNEKTKKLVNALIDYLNIQEKFVLKGGLFIGTTIDDVFEKPYQKELNIKLSYIDEEELKAYRDEK